MVMLRFEDLAKRKTFLRLDARIQRNLCGAPVLWNRQAASGPLPPDVYGSKADAIGGRAAEMRQSAAWCPQLKYGLTERHGAAIDAIDPLRTSASRRKLVQEIDFTDVDFDYFEFDGNAEHIIHRDTHS
jgi:hypothetical protein